MIGIDDQTFCRHVRTASRPVRSRLCRAQDVYAVHCDHGYSRWLLHPPRTSVLERLASGERVGLTRLDDLRVEPIDARPVLRLCCPDFSTPEKLARGQPRARPERL